MDVALPGLAAVCIGHEDHMTACRRLGKVRCCRRRKAEHPLHGGTCRYCLRLLMMTAGVDAEASPRIRMAFC